jgi:hypothetical protein
VNVDPARPAGKAGELKEGTGSLDVGPPVMRRSFRTHPIHQRPYPRVATWAGMRRPVGTVPNRGVGPTVVQELVETGTGSVPRETLGEIGTGSVEEIGTGSEVP